MHNPMQNNEKPQGKLDQALAALRAEQPEPGAIEAASERVRERLSQESHNRIMSSQAGLDNGCGNVRMLLPQYRAGQLSASKALLVKDHLYECVSCRKEAETGIGAPLVAWNRELPKPQQNQFRWIAVAAAVIVVAVSSYFVRERLAVPEGSRAQVESTNGLLYLVSARGQRPLQVGEEISEGEKVRTAGGARAMLRLRDGSLVEMSEHAEFSVAVRRVDTTIHLDRGNIIVQAAKRKTGHLYVAAKDCLVSVTGTVFSVNSGLKGSRVSVIEGEVRVASAAATKVLHPGDQVSTNPSIGTVPVQDEIAWSGNLDKHLALLAEFAHLQNKLAAVAMPGMRFGSHLLKLLPQSTLVYAGIPNLGDAIHQADQLFQQELQESAVLREWWDQQLKSGHNHNNFNYEDAVQKLQQLGRYLGDEIVFSANSQNRKGGILLVAQVTQPGLKDFLKQQLSQLENGNGSHHGGINVLDEQELMSQRPGDSGKGLLVLVRSDFVAVSSELETLQNFDLQIHRGGGGFDSTAFGQRLLQAYSGGTGLLFGADLQAMEGHIANEGRGNMLENTGFEGLKFLIAERKDVSGEPLNHAELTFNGPRHGLASWLANPVPIGGLDFISANAGAVLAVATKTPGLMLDDVLKIAKSKGKGEEELQRAESELKIRFREDLANALGGEFTLALDGPILPTPSWKLIVEVNDPVRLQQTIEQLVTDAGAHAHNGESVKLDQTITNGTTLHVLRYVEQGKTVEVTYTFADGFLVAGPGEAIVMDALRVHQNGDSLAKSSTFHSLMPQDKFTDVSAILYQNIAPVIAPIASKLSASQLQSLGQIAAETKPSVVCAYGEESAVTVASNSRFFGLDLNTLAVSTLLKIAHPPASPGATN